MSQFQKLQKRRTTANQRHLHPVQQSQRHKAQTRRRKCFKQMFRKTHSCSISTGIDHHEKVQRMVSMLVTLTIRENLGTTGDDNLMHDGTACGESGHLSGFSEPELITITDTVTWAQAIEKAISLLEQLCRPRVDQTSLKPELEGWLSEPHIPVMLGDSIKWVRVGIKAFAQYRDEDTNTNTKLEAIEKGFEELPDTLKLLHGKPGVRQAHIKELWAL
ncbi:hypothetical protein FBEOM_8549 [Fusarium beomiforme]|uniref:Uncharacterized protein n=1 Tax=Fusarium beomiforme TaxID=44412 RepID=A0A9P5AFD7_9HYPO|nr:hypothetical protein FBEOM_8549 [Fusarium beomiforme]